ncbi:uncharacterized protein PGTG_00964 [Puccinia graminis f. sp. tritici CRL 75-36-700-3]|uniref:Ubiquitin 3 binding protein But2 C-terminal domain-containing protein n=1 Tax=Puccinia graminis f. sp. tritici (strain CRL 75-36-700-3 / race SCCL) TaxID=418459 RepID=E3JUA8_PUCGT|nr:uncharacterized protein PGTG_00964 [Puccinia graminis f. sp. tritici CRL 75-36-700-3]EFP75633.1 hypothetical protein PGTG_00964 [Puccinia graminis f. sp. tritici CRL 75-36-700-3]
MFLLVLLLAALSASTTMAAHKVTVINKCQQKFTMQVPGRGIVSSGGGGSWSYNGDVRGVIASVGNNCDVNGVPCTAAEFSLVSGITSADITLIPPHRYNHSLRITLTNGKSKSCNSAGFPGAFHQDGNDGLYQIQESNNPNSGIKLEFCY